MTHPGAPLYLSPLAQAPLKHRVSCSGSNGKARNGDKVSVKRKERTNLEIRHVVLQQGPGGLDVFFSTHKHKGNHALMKDKKKRTDYDYFKIKQKSATIQHEMGTKK